jgi:hypothetical protein
MAQICCRFTWLTLSSCWFPCLRMHLIRLARSSHRCLFNLHLLIRSKTYVKVGYKHKDSFVLRTYPGSPWCHSSKKEI